MQVSPYFNLHLCPNQSVVISFVATMIIMTIMITRGNIIDVEFFSGQEGSNAGLDEHCPFWQESCGLNFLVGRVDKAEKMSNFFLECGASHGSSLG